VRNSFVSNGRLYDGTAATGTTFFDDVCISVQPESALTQPLPGLIIGPNETFFGRRLNPENRGGQIRNDGGDLWILGFKTEQYDSDFKIAPHVHTRNGGSTEILGGFIHAMHSGNGGIDSDAPPVFLIENARASFTAIENASNDQSYPITVRETRGGVTRDLTFLQSPLNGSNASHNLSFKLPLYVGYSGSGNQAPTLQLISPAGGRALLSTPRLALVAQADDDGLPNPLALAWSQVSGPAGVVFAAPASASTDATFPGDGTYLLRLSATDGELGRTLDITVTVNSAPPTVPTSGLILRYDLDQAAGSTVADSSGGGHNGSIINLGQGEWLPGAGVIDGAYRIKTPGPAYSWLNGRIEVADTLPATTRQTVASWVRQDFDSTTSTLHVAHINGLDFYFNHNFDFVGVNAYYGDPDSFTIATRSWEFPVKLPAKGTWFHLAVTFDSTDANTPPRFYLNGVEVAYTAGASGNTGGYPYLAKSNMVKSFVGARCFYPAQGMHDGSLDQFVAYDRVLAPSEIATLYASNLGNLAPVVSAGPDFSTPTGSPVTLPTSVTDDGLPLTPGALSLQWTKLSGPAGPTWSSTTVAAPEVTFLNAGTYTFRLAASDGSVTSYDTVTVTATGGNIHLPPVASAVSISGSPRLDSLLTLAYTYSDPNNDPENAGTTSFRWLRGDLPGGAFLPISGATASTYTLQASDHGKYFRAEVTPRATVEPYVGAPALSAPIGPVAPLAGILPPVTDGLIAFWPFDDRVSPTTDFSANAYQASLQTGATFAADGRHASALAPSTNAGSTASPVAAPTHDFTFTTWVRHNSYTTQTNEIILGKGWDAFVFYMATGVNNGELRIQFRDNLGTQFNANYTNARDWIPSEQWTHLAAVREGSALRLYVNGLLRSVHYTTGAGAHPMATNNTLLGIGNMSGASHWDGLIDQTGLFSRALSEAEISEMMDFNPALGQGVEPPPDTGPQLLLHLNFDDASPLDASPFARSVTSNTEYATADGRSYATFNGVNQRLVVPLQRTFTEGITIAFWTRAADGENGMPKNAALGWARQDNADGLVLAPGWNNATNQLFRIGHSGGVFDQINTPVLTDFLNTWVHWTFVKDVAAGTLQVYRDGQAFGAAATNKTIVPVFENSSSTGGTIGGLRIGDLWGSYYKGDLDDYRIYDRPLDANAIEALYLESLPGAPAEPTYTTFAATTFAHLSGGASHPDAAPTADPDADGLPNFLEYALNLDPLTPGTSGLPVSAFSAQSSHLTLTFQRARAELTYEVLASTTLAPDSWTVIATNPGTVSLTESVTVEDTELVSENPKRFLRLRVTE
jgi:hypothetical protein